MPSEIELSNHLKITGEPPKAPVELRHLKGMPNQKSAIVVGTEAHQHLQLDIYGELLDAVYVYNVSARQISYRPSTLHKRILLH
jgi:hypothetical protein